MNAEVTTVCHMTLSKVKVRVTEVRKLRKWPISKSISSANEHAIKKKLTVNSDTRQISKFCPDRFLILCGVKLQSSWNGIFK